MYIKEIILDGFKSYPTRTVVSGFDPAFNAITGLNGSGKSNILDSICFVLGITNLSQVPVGNLHELVYKQGQAGVTKASVTIVFDNSDADTSPVGYEQYAEITICRQVVINGKNKYLINGHTAQQEQVKNLFHSVQLNVNNPHFLIMQGRITKVLNMNAMEILSMIEEAAGTRMFETKKQAAIKTMEKKEAKNVEIDRVLSEEITPTLDKLRMEKTNYLSYTGNATKVRGRGGEELLLLLLLLLLAPQPPEYARNELFLPCFSPNFLPADRAPGPILHGVPVQRGAVDPRGVGQGAREDEGDHRCAGRQGPGARGEDQGEGGRHGGAVAQARRRHVQGLQQGQGH